MGVRLVKIVKDVIPSMFRTGQILHMQECLPQNTTVSSIYYNTESEQLEIIVENDCWDDATLETIELVMESHSDSTHRIVERPSTTFIDDVGHAERGAHIIDNPRTAVAVPDREEEDVALPQLRASRAVATMDETEHVPNDAYERLYGEPVVAQLAGEVEEKAKKLRKKEVTMHSCACPYCSNNVKVLVSDREPTLMCTG